MYRILKEIETKTNNIWKVSTYSEYLLQGWGSRRREVVSLFPYHATSLVIYDTVGEIDFTSLLSSFFMPYNNGAHLHNSWVRIVVAIHAYRYTHTKLHDDGRTISFCMYGASRVYVCAFDRILFLYVVNYIVQLL